MVRSEKVDESVRFEVENVGGIDQTHAELSPGLTILTGRNASNRTSFLQAIMAVMGSDRASLKADADEGRAQLQFGDETYSCTLQRRNGRIAINGDRYLDDATLADLYAFLLETNECRQAVARGDDLREIIMRPVDTANIKQKITDMEVERDDIDSKLARLDDIGDEISDMKRKKSNMEDEMAEKESELADVESEIADIEGNVDETREGKAELDEKLEELQEVRRELERTRNQVETEKQSIDALRTERTEVEAELEELDPISDEDVTAHREEIQRLRGQVDAINQTVNELQSVIQFNDEFLSDEQPEIATRLRESASSDDAVTEQLLSDGRDTVCWTCGSEVQADQIESTLEQLRELRQRKMSDRRGIEDEIDELRSEVRQLEERRERRQRFVGKREEIEAEIADREENLDEILGRQDRLRADITQLEAAVDELREEDYSDILDVHKEANELEFEIERLANKLSETEDEIAEMESELARRDDLEAEREETESRIRELRTRVETLQEQAIEEFNEHMDAVLDLLGYENLERIWIERTHETVREGRRKVEQARFDLHIVRSTDDDAVYEDTVEHLSESEREVTGLVFALAGYLVHDVYEEVPFMLLDSVEAIDSDRLARLIEYLEDHAEYLVVALLEEDATALDDEHARISSI